MKKIVVTTTVNAPTEAIRKFDAMNDWELLVIGDKKTPVYELDRGYFMNCAEQLDRYADLVSLIGWNSVARGRMIGFIEAYKRGAAVIASIDDDCIPDKSWGQDVVLGRPSRCQEVKVKSGIFDPCHTCGIPYFARGFPIEYMADYEHEVQDDFVYPSALVRVDFCRKQGDFNAYNRLHLNGGPNEFMPQVGLPIWAKAFSPINTQNTFIHRLAMRDFPANIPFIGRADDIWAGYIFQRVHPFRTIYGSASADHIQERTMQSVVNDLEREIYCYRNTAKFLTTLRQYGPSEAIELHMPEAAKRAIAIYRSYFDDKSSNPEPITAKTVGGII